MGTNLRQQDRMKTFIGGRGEQLLKAAKEKEAVQQAQSLEEFKGFLQEQLEELGEDQAKDMSVQEFTKAVARKQAAEVYERTLDDKPPEKKIKMYPNTKIPVQKVQAKNTHKD